MKPESYICFATFFAIWGDRMWTFAVGLYMVKITPDSLQLAATFGLVLSLSAVIFAPMIGDWIDRNSRLYVLRVLLFFQNFLVMISAGVVMVYLYQVTDEPSVLGIFKALIIVSGSLADLAGQGEKIVIGRDWVVVVSRGNNDVLTTTNAMIRRIDLTVAILAPLAVSLLMFLISDAAGLIFVCSWNVISMFGEYVILLKVYKMVPELSQKPTENERLRLESKDKGDGSTKSTFKTTSSQIASLIFRFKTILSGWKTYYKQSVFLAGCVLAALYLTVIGFGHVTIGYAYMEGLSELHVSTFMAVSSVVGVFGTFLFPNIRKRFGLLKTGFIGFLLQWPVLLLCVVSIWLPGSPSNMYTDPNTDNVILSNATASLNSTTTGNLVPQKKDLTSIIVLMTGIILSRAGLYISDLTIVQIQQENVPEEERGIVGGVQHSFNCLSDICRFALTIILPAREQFGMLILISVIAIGCSGIIYIVFMYHFKKRGNYLSLNNSTSNRENVPEHAEEKISIMERKPSRGKKDGSEQSNYATIAL